MAKQKQPPYEQLLQEWVFRREIVNHYSGALRLLMPDDPDAAQRWRTLGGQLDRAEETVSQLSAQLRRAYPDQAPDDLA
jgi:hypothetical protein